MSARCRGDLKGELDHLTHGEGGQDIAIIDPSAPEGAGVLVIF
jgi:hypothetical protein